MADEILRNVLRGENSKKKKMGKIYIFTRRTLHSSLPTIDSYGNYLFAMDIYQELSEDPH